VHSTNQPDTHSNPNPNLAILSITDCGVYRRCRMLQNASLMGTRRRDHITPVMPVQLYWMPVRQRVKFKLADLMCRVSNGLEPPYLPNDCQLFSASSRRQLRSSCIQTCVLQRTTTRLGDRAFAAAGQRLWNSLPTDYDNLTSTSDNSVGRLSRICSADGGSAL